MPTSINVKPEPYVQKYHCIFLVKNCVTGPLLRLKLQQIINKLINNY